MKYVPKFLLVLLMVFAPIQAAIITVFVLIMADLVTGVYAAWKSEELITSSGLRRTITKLCVYEAALLLGFLTQTYLTGPYVPVSTIVSTFIGVTELKSVIENLNSISGGSLLASLVSKLGSDNGRK